MDNSKLWNSFLERIKNEVTPITYQTWFADTKIAYIKDNIVTIAVPMHVHKTMLSQSYNELIEEVFTEISGSNLKFNYLTNEELEQLSIDDNPKVEETHISNFESNLISNYTFDNFIVGSSNRFAQRTALAVAEKPGQMFNPFFLYGNSGLGKTHLMHAIGNYAAKHNKSKVLYVTSEKFVEDFIGINRKSHDENNYDNVKLFKKKYRDVDILIIDDIQYLSNALKTQDEFFNTFTELYTQKKQIIISSDRSPDDLKLLEERLRTRFTWGMSIDIKPPDFELRMNIIEKKIEEKMIDVNVDKDVKEYIANNCTTNIRKLEGAITRVIAYATMFKGGNINLDLAHEALKGFFSETIVSKNKVQQVQQLVAKNYNITVDDLKSKRRVATVAFPRQVAMYICRKELNESFPKIGIEFGGKDHTTVMHSVVKIEKLLKKQPELQQVINKIVVKIE